MAQIRAAFLADRQYLQQLLDNNIIILICIYRFIKYK